MCVPPLATRLVLASLLCGLAYSASAVETHPAVIYVRYFYNGVWYGPEFLNNQPTAEACATAAAERFPLGQWRGVLNASKVCEYRSPTQGWGGTLGYENYRVGCPDTSWTFSGNPQNWTLSGTTCTRPDCTASQTRDADGVCRDTCPAGTNWSPALSSCSCPL